MIGAKSDSQKQKSPVLLSLDKSSWNDTTVWYSFSVMALCLVSWFYESHLQVRYQHFAED